MHMHGGTRQPTGGGLLQRTGEEGTGSVEEASRVTYRTILHEKMSTGRPAWISLGRRTALCRN